MSWWHDGFHGRRLDRTGDPDVDEHARHSHRSGQIWGDIVNGTDNSGFGFNQQPNPRSSTSWDWGGSSSTSSWGGSGSSGSGGSSVSPETGWAVLIAGGFIACVWFVMRFADPILILCVGGAIAVAIRFASKRLAVRRTTVLVTMGLATAACEWAYATSTFAPSQIARWAWLHPWWSASFLAGLLLASSLSCKLVDLVVDWMARDGNWRSQPVVVSALGLAALAVVAMRLPSFEPRPASPPMAPAQTTKVESRPPAVAHATPPVAAAVADVQLLRAPGDLVGRTAVVAVRTSLALRGGPSTEFDPPIDRVGNGTRLEVVGFEDGWYEVVDAAGRRLFADARYLRPAER